MKNSLFLSAEIDFSRTLCFHVTADKYCDTSPCHGGLQTLRSIRFCFYSASSLKPVHSFSSVSDSTARAENASSKTTLLIELEQQQKKRDSKKRHCPFGSADAVFCCHVWMILVSFCLFLALLLFHSLLYLLFLMADWRQRGKKEKVSETDSEEKMDEEDGWGLEGRGGATCLQARL